MIPESADPARVILGNFDLTAQLPNGRMIKVSGYVYSDDDGVALDKRLDLYQERIERQRTRCEIPELEAKREQQVVALRQYQEHLEGLNVKREQGKTLSSQERMALQNAKVNIERANSDIKKGDEAIAEAKRKAGVA